MLIKNLKTVCLLASVFAMTIAHATTSKNMDLTEVTQASSLVIAGEVLSSVTTMNNGSAQTEVTVRVDDAIKGSSSSTVTIVMPGGSFVSNGIRLGENVPGVTKTFVEQRGVYFLTNMQEQGKYQITGFSQGMLAISSSNGVDTLRGKLTNGQEFTLAEIKEKIKAVEAQ